MADGPRPPVCMWQGHSDSSWQVGSLLQRCKMGPMLVQTLIPFCCPSGPTTELFPSQALHDEVEERLVMSILGPQRPLTSSGLHTGVCGMCMGACVRL